MDATYRQRTCGPGRKGELRLGPLRPAARWLTAPARARPTFLVIGAQKSGTTSLHRYLVQHPAILCPTPKEIHFFDIGYHRGEAWYLAQFPWRTRTVWIHRSTGVQPAVGEATPEYLFYPRVPERVHVFDPHLKLVVVLRDPVDRAYSQYNMQVRKLGETLPFEHVLALEETELPRELERMCEDPTYFSPTRLRRSYVARGRYAEQIERWLSFFPRTDMLVLTSEELLDHPAAAMARIAAFLGVPEWRAEAYALWSTGNYTSMSAETRERLAQTFEPHNRRLEKLLGREFGWMRPEARTTTGTRR